ncbi:MAG: serine/threonine protein kinase [Proteobacteria bacterium]|nr:serine/threonine protein kinase [Pseudomonadota bacterium]
MAICPVCHATGDLGQECTKCHKHFVEEEDLKKSDNDEMLGDLVGGQYVPLSVIGEGGMGKIYKAKAKYMGITVALKVLKSEYMENETLKDRFFREAEVISRLDHPNIVKLYGCAPDEVHNTIFMAMELLKGRTLFDVLRKNVPSLDVMLRFFCEIASALGEAHKNGIFHRDLKPENVFIVQDDEGVEHVRVLDFGFARLQNAAKKLTMAGVAFGTPHYMSPEQAMGLDDITAACDVYALGIMLFQAISGNVPFDSPTNSPMEVMYAQVYNNTPTCNPRPEYQVPKRLLNCIYKCMKKDPKDRYADGHELYLELTEISKELSSGVKVDNRPESAKETVMMKPEGGSFMSAASGEKKFPLIPVLAGIFVFLVVVTIILVAVVL